MTDSLHHDPLPTDVEALQAEVVRLREAQNHAARLERRLEAAEARLEAVLSNAPLVVFTVDTDGTLTMVEGQALEGLGAHPGENVGNNVFELLAGNPAVDHLRQALAGEVVAQHVELPDGQHYDARYAPRRDAGGAVVGAICVAFDVTDRAEAERRRDEALRQAQEKAHYLDTVLEALPVGVFIADATGRILQANAQAAHIWGGNVPLVDDEAGYHAYEGWWPETGERVQPHEWPLSRAIRERASLTRQITDIRRFDGTRATIANSAAPILTEDGTLLGGVVVVQDVTAQQQAERALRASEDRFRRLFEGSTHGVLLGDLYGSLTYANHAALEMLGYSREEVESGVLRWTDVTPLEYGPLDARAVRELAATGRATLYEKDLIRRDGTRIPVLSGAAVLEVDSEGREVIASFITDISSRKVAEQALRRSEARLRQALDASRMGYWDWDVAEGRLYWGGHSAELLGLAEGVEESTLDGLLAKVDPDHRRTLEHRLRRAAETGEAFAVDFRLASAPDDAARWLNMQGQPVAPEGEQPATLSGVLADVTVRKQIEHRWAEMMRREQLARAAAEEANQTKTRFLGMISHELRTPLTSVRGFTSTLLAPDVEWDLESQREFITIIHQEAERLTELVEQLLDVSRMQAGTLSVHPEPQPLAALFDQALPQLAVLAARHELALDVPPRLPTVRADPRRAVQILANLVGNAAKFAPEGTTIRIRARAEPDAVRIEVADQGEGIPPGQRETVFEMFRQAESEHHQAEGTGLGLAICRALVEAHGGRIWVVEQDPPGTTIAFTLPLDAAD